MSCIIWLIISNNNIVVIIILNNNVIIVINNYVVVVINNIVIIVFYFKLFIIELEFVWIFIRPRYCYLKSTILRNEYPFSTVFFLEISSDTNSNDISYSSSAAFLASRLLGTDTSSDSSTFFCPSLNQSLLQSMQP